MLSRKQIIGASFCETAVCLLCRKWDVDENCFTGQDIKERSIQCKWGASNAACTEYFASVANGERSQSFWASEETMYIEQAWL